MGNGKTAFISTNPSRVPELRAQRDLRRAAVIFADTLREANLNTDDGMLDVSKAEDLLYAAALAYAEVRR